MHSVYIAEMVGYTSETTVEKTVVLCNVRVRVQKKKRIVNRHCIFNFQSTDKGTLPDCPPAGFAVLIREILTLKVNN